MKPSLLQAALLAREFDDTIQYHPPRVVQKPLFAALAPLARLRGLRGSYPQYERHAGGVVEHLESLPQHIAALLPIAAPPSAHTGQLPTPDPAAG